MIDLHCHILPAIDDGPASSTDSFALALELTRAGVRSVAATPHLRDDFPQVRPDELASRCADLSTLLRASDVRLDVIPAAELDLVRALEASDEDRRLASYAQLGSDMLLESPYGPLTTSFEEQLFELSVRGYRILLAHPERNPSFQSDPARLGALVRRGVLLQVTAGALLRRSGSRSGKLARELVADRMAHVLASDAHGPQGPHRVPLSAGVAEARQLAGSYADWMVEDAPAAILAGESLPTPPAIPRPRRRSIRERLVHGRRLRSTQDGHSDS